MTHRRFDASIRNRRGAALALVAALILCLPQAAAFAEGGERGDWEAGFYTGLTFPDDYRGAKPDTDLLFGLRLGYFMFEKWSLEGSYQRFSSETDIANLDFDINSLRFNALRHFRPGERLRPFVTFGVGHEETDVNTVGDSSDLGLNAGGGLRWLLRDNLGLRFDGRWVSTDVGSPVSKRQSNLEATVGLLWTFGGKAPGDADGDGVLDRDDRCPDTPRGARVDEDGCPTDADGDGVWDGLDRCPDTPAGTPVDEKGCPIDSDGDGVHDGLDRCPDTPKGATVDAAGCPTDADGDGVWDGLDRCPDTPKGATVDRKGCPKDSDGDGVWDGLDRCPDTPRGTEVDARGCPVLFEEGKRTLVLRGVNFAFNSDKLTAESTTILDNVVATLGEWKKVRVEVAGHTDSVGSDKYNRDLSQRRAESVRRYLVDRGIAESRLRAKGYGESQPVADNATEEGRLENRRVELKRID